MNSRGVQLELDGIVSRELFSGHYSVRTDQGQEVLAFVPVLTRLPRAVRPGDRVHLTLSLDDTAPGRIHSIQSPHAAPGG